MIIYISKTILLKIAGKELVKNAKESGKRKYRKSKHAK